MKHHDPTEFTACEWRERFDAFLRERMATPFQWGVHDCCLYAADAVRASTGVDLAADLRGTYGTALAAAHVLQSVGGLAGAASRAGPEIAPLTARVGDVGIVNDGHQDALAVCHGEVWLVPGKDGVGALPFDAAKRAWRVAHG